MEQYQLVDRDGNITSKIINNDELYTKGIEKGYFLPVVGIVIYNDNKQVLFQKRSKYKKIKPSKWGLCGGKVNLNETFEDAGIRETLEEIGIILNKKDLKLISSKFEGDGYFKVFAVNLNLDISKCIINLEEVEELKYINVEDISKLDSEVTEWLESFIEKI